MPPRNALRFRWVGLAEGDRGMTCRFREKRERHRVLKVMPSLGRPCRWWARYVRSTLHGADRDPRVCAVMGGLVGLDARHQLLCQTQTGPTHGHGLCEHVLHALSAVKDD